MRIFILSLIISCVSGGVINGFTSRQKLGGLTRSAISETKTIQAFYRGKFVAYLVPYVNSRDRGTITDVVELLWEHPSGSRYTLDMMTIDWPAGAHTLSVVTPSIEPKDPGNKNTLKVKFYKTKSSTSKTYTKPA